MAQPSNLELAVLQKLSSRFGPMKSDDGVMARMDGGDLLEEDIMQAKSEVENEARFVAVKNEASRRIFVVTKDAFTQINIALWLATEKSGPDLVTAKALVKWMSDMRATARKLKRNPNFREDRLWPPVPPGVKELIDRF